MQILCHAYPPVKTVRSAVSGSRRYQKTGCGPQNSEFPAALAFLKGIVYTIPVQGDWERTHHEENAIFATGGPGGPLHSFSRAILARLDTLFLEPLSTGVPGGGHPFRGSTRTALAAPIF